MDYDYIEMLVLQAKNQDYNAKEKLVDEFTPFITLTFNIFKFISINEWF